MAGTQTAQQTVTAPRPLTRSQKAWRALFWTSTIGSLLMAVAGFVVFFLWFVEEMADNPVGPVDFSHPALYLAGVLFGSGLLVDLTIGRVASDHRPVSQRMVCRMEKLADNKRRATLAGAGEPLIILRTVLPNLMGRMWRTQLVLRENNRTRGYVVVSIPTLAADVGGADRRFALLRYKAPAWLCEERPGYRFHARVNLPDLEDAGRWGYVIDFERGVPTAR